MKTHTHNWRNLGADNHGGVLITTALTIFMLIAIAGAAIDFGRWALVDLRAQQAADAAALAVAINPYNPPTTDTESNRTAARYFAMNYPENYLGVAIPAGNVHGDYSPTAIKVTVDGISMPTYFIQFVGIPALPIRATNQINPNINKNASDYDLVVVFDETFSTAADVPLNYPPVGPTRMSLMQTAMTNYVVNNIFPPGTSNPNVRIGFVGYSSHITSKWGLSSIKDDATSAINQFRPTGNNYDYVAMQAALQMLSGGTPGIANEVITTNESGNPYPRETFVPSDPPFCLIQQLLKDPTRENPHTFNTACYGPYSFSTYDSAPDPTNIHMPVARTARTAASDANGLSPVKYVLFITDGDIMTDVAPCADDYDGRNDGSTDPINGPNNHENGRPGTNCYSNSTARNFPVFIDSCTALKNLGAHVYVINFATKDTNAIGAMEACASPHISTGPSDPKADGEPDFYFAADAAQLNDTLNNIVTIIKSIKIVQ